MKSPSETRALLAALEAQHPAATTELHYASPWELLVATILSAQTTDQRVNQVTPALFLRFPDSGALAGASISEVQVLIRPTGFFRQKARAIVGVAEAVATRHAGVVPPSMAALVELPGVGRKTANVVLGHALGVPGFAVDRHVLRVTNRIGMTDSPDPEVVEQQVTRALPADAWTRASDTLILHGRRICKPRPLCDRCAVRASCEFAIAAVAAPPPPAGSRRPRPSSSRSRAAAPRQSPRRKRSAK